jgi:hypothetical protein
MRLLYTLGVGLILATLSYISGNFPTIAGAAPCDRSQSVPLRSTTTYGIFGNDVFDTVACGYLLTRQMMVWDEPITVAYFRIIQFGDEGFRRAIQAGIDQGNTVNQFTDGRYEFNLGCFENNQIKGVQFNPQQPYLTPEEQRALRQSSSEAPITLKFSFGRHLGSECICCNLAHTVRLLPKETTPSP